MITVGSNSAPGYYSVDAHFLGTPVCNLSLTYDPSRPRFLVLMVTETHQALISPNYTTRNYRHHDAPIEFSSRNSPAIMSPTHIALHGAFPDFNHKPHIYDLGLDVEAAADRIDFLIKNLRKSMILCFQEPLQKWANQQGHE